MLPYFRRKGVYINPNDLINQAMGSGGRMIGGDDLFILEGHAEQNEFRIKNADDVYKNNLIAFAWKVPTGYTFLGMYTTEEAAREAVEVIRTLFYDEEGNMLL